MDDAPTRPDQAAGPRLAEPAPRDPDRMPRWLPKAVLLVIVMWFGAQAALALFWILRDILLWLVAALFLSFALEPAVNWLVQHGWRRGVASAVVVLGLGVLALIAVAAMVPLVIDQVKQLIDKLPGWLERISVYTKRWFDLELTGQKILDSIKNAQTDVGAVAANVASVGAFILGLIFQVLTIGLFTFYLVADAPRFRRTVCSVLPPQRQREVLAAWEIAVDKTGGYLYSRLFLAIISSTFAFFALMALGVPFAVPLALFLGFVSQFIPVVGTYIAAAVPLLVALLENPWSALFFLVYVVVYQQIENYLLAPRVTARTMQLHPAVAFFAALAGGSLGGVIGAFLALPAAAIIQATVSTYLTRHEVVESQLTQQGEEPEEPRPEHARGGFMAWIKRAPPSDERAGPDGSDDPRSD